VDNPKKVMIIGGGLAGMQAGVVATFLWEKYYIHLIAKLIFLVKKIEKGM